GEYGRNGCWPNETRCIGQALLNMTSTQCKHKELAIVRMILMANLSPAQRARLDRINADHEPEFYLDALTEREVAALATGVVPLRVRESCERLLNYHVGSSSTSPEDPRCCRPCRPLFARACRAP